MKITMKASANGSANLSMGTWGGSENIGLEFTASTDFVEYTATCASVTAGVASSNDGHVLFQCGKFIGTVYIQKVEVIEVAPDTPIAKPNWTDIIKGNEKCYYKKEYTCGDPQYSGEIGYAEFVNGEVPVNSVAKVANDWDTQFFVRSPQKIKSGTKCILKFKYKATAEVSTGSPQIHNEPGEYCGNTSAPGLNCTTEYKDYEGEFTASGDFHTVTFNLSVSQDVVYYFKDATFEIDEEAVTENDFAEDVMTIPYVDPTSVGIKSVKADEATGEIFDLQGRRVNSVNKGIYVVNGKKVVF